jgi:glutamate racemase
VNAARRRIAMFDSGLGGLTLLNALRAAVPDADVLYAADTARVPYGDRPLAEVAGFARQIIARLERYDPALLVIACGTSCSAFDRLGTPPTAVRLLPVVDCGVKAAVAASKNGRIGVIATAATIRSGVFERKIKRLRPHATITAVSAPRLVPLVESGAWGSEQAREAVNEYCRPLVAAECDTTLLGCTHFPHLTAWFRSALGPGPAIVDPARQCANETRTMLDSLQPGSATLTFEVSGDSDAFRRLAAQLADIGDARVRRVDFAREPSAPGPVSDQTKQPEYN